MLQGRRAARSNGLRVLRLRMIANLPKVVGGFSEKIKLDVVKFGYCLILGG
jgi:hypothetical protein